VHCKPEVTNERLTWAAKLVLDHRPDVVVCLGDFYDLPSLSSYDKGKKTGEGRRIKEDLDAGEDGLIKFNAPINEYNEICRKNKKAQYKPRMVMIGANHDFGRINRAINMSPELEGIISVDSLKYKEYGWEVIDYQIPIEIDGIWYCHFFPSGVKGEPISGINLATSLLAKNMVSSTVGHSHLLDYAIKITPSGKRVHGLSAGCFFTHPEEYAKATEHLWWRGLAIKHNVKDGDYDLELMSMNRLKEAYGN
jgi:hypothetical protein